jgi:hypothetical protein
MDLLTIAELVALTRMLADLVRTIDETNVLVEKYLKARRAGAPPPPLVLPAAGRRLM